MSTIIIPGIDGKFKKLDNVDPNAPCGNGTYRDIPGVLINPCLPQCDQKYWKLINGRIVEMTTEEKAALDASISAALAAAKLAEQDAADASLNLSMLEVVTALIQVINLRIPTNKITKAELVAQIKANRK